VALFAAAGCSGSSLSDDKAASGGTIKIGLITPQTGVYKAFDKDITQGWQLYLDEHGGKLGGHKVEVVKADEGEGKQTALTSAKKLLDKDKVDVLVGGASADTVATLQSTVNEHKVPFVGTGGRPSTLKDVSYIWHASWLSEQNGEAGADYIRTTVKGPVYAIGPNYIGGWDQVGGFTKAFTKGGGKLANSNGKTTWTPWPTTTNFLPYFNQIKASGAKAIYTFYAGTAAIQFVKDYAASGLAPEIPLYGSGFLTEGSLLTAEGAKATGVKTVMNYAANLDNAANRKFAPAFQQKYGTSPSIFCVTGWDAALVVDRAIAKAGADPTSESINKAIGGLGAIDSPRGSWRFGTGHTPIQPWYLRDVKSDGRALSNVVIQNLATIGS
jgi:branched-chain amino acid transport system substrate-binding protein